MVDSDRSQRAGVVVQQVTEKICTNLPVETQCFLGRNPEGMAPWGLFFAYRICGDHMRSSRESSNSSEVLKSLKRTFIAIDVRWNVAGTSPYFYAFL
jgi:hypothetical protein